MTWEDGHSSAFNLNWLKKRSFRTEKQNSWLDSDYQAPYSTWNSECIRDAMPKFKFEEILHSDEVLLKWLQHLEVFGVCLIEQVPDSLGQVGSLANRVGFIKRTHYGYVLLVSAHLIDFYITHLIIIVLLVNSIVFKRKLMLLTLHTHRGTCNCTRIYLIMNTNLE